MRPDSTERKSPWGAPARPVLLRQGKVAMLDRAGRCAKAWASKPPIAKLDMRTA
jgi:hypothetical protein